jgi:hypothetical protein
MARLLETRFCFFFYILAMQNGLKELWELLLVLLAQGPLKFVRRHWHPVRPGVAAGSPG